jgi:hypothetical protein
MNKHLATYVSSYAAFPSLVVMTLIANLNAQQAGPISASRTDQKAAAPVKDARESDSGIARNWLPFPDSTKFKVLGLYWFDGNKPLLWRLPKTQFDTLPKGVQRGCKHPSGARIALACDTTALGLKVHAAGSGSLKGFDVYINGVHHGSAGVKTANTDTNIVLFKGLEKKMREVVIYLPCRQEVTVEAVGVDENAKFSAPVPRFAKPLPIVFYGSSVCQGNGASRPGMTYEAILARDLNLDFINLGFGGAGKAEEDVVKLVNTIPARPRKPLSNSSTPFPPAATSSTLASPTARRT